MSPLQEPPGTKMAAADFLHKQGNCAPCTPASGLVLRFLRASNSWVKALMDQQGNGKELVKGGRRGSEKEEQHGNDATALNYKNTKFPPIT